VRILVQGLPGSGKTYMSTILKDELKCAYFNADEIRKMANDWDFSLNGRLRQARRMKAFSEFESINGRIVICDFICPTVEAQEIFDADMVIFMNTIEEGRFEDTNRMFSIPINPDFEITEKNAEKYVSEIVDYIRYRTKQ
jgi:adenylylsulfate kinase